MSIPAVNNTSNKPAACLKNCWAKFQKCINDEKVKKVIGLALSLIIGTSIGALIGTPIGATAIILGAVVGGATGGFVYAAVTSVLYVIQMMGYPAHDHVQAKGKPISLNKQGWETDDHLGVFRDVIKEQFANKQWFKDWKAHKKFEDNNQAAEYLFGKWVRKGVSLGESQELLRATKKDSDAKGEEFLAKVRAEGLFIRQIPEFIRKDLRNSDKETLKIQVEEEVNKFSDLELTEQPIPYEFKNFDSFKADLKQRLDTGLTGAIFQLKGQNDPALFIRLKKPYSFYDPFSNTFGGLHEFKSKEDFIEKLYEHLKCYGSRWRLMKPLEWGTIKYYR